MGHAIVSLVTGGGVKSISIQMTSAGETISTFRRTPLGRISSALSLLAGYPAPGAFGTFLLIQLGQYELQIATNTIIGTCLICFAFSCKGRSVIGIFYTLTFAAISAILHYYISDNNYTYLWIAILSATLYIGSISSIWDLFKLTILYPNGGNDAIFCSERIFPLPPLIWALVLAGLSGLAVGVMQYFTNLDYSMIVENTLSIITAIASTISLK
jgi:hypothetical protein